VSLSVTAAPQMTRAKLIDLNGVLGAMNLLVAALIVLVFDQVGDNPYVDENTLLLGLVLCAQTQIALWYERRQRDPFVILLAIEMIVYYALRLVTLALYPFSGVFDRYAYDPADSNRALLLILLANVLLYGGLFFAKFNGARSVTARDWRATSPGRTVFLLVAAVLIGYSSVGYADPENSSNLLSLLSFFFEPRTIIMMSLAYYLLYRDSLSRIFALTIAALIIIEMAVHTLAGSRSAIVGFIENCTMVVLAIAGCIQFSRKYLLIGVLLSPIIIGLMVVSFAISTYNRAHRDTGLGAAFDVSQALSSARESGADLALGPSLDLVLPPIFARAGFFDFSAEIIAHREQYRSVLNLPAYAKSIVDNDLTPGFDVFDQPKTATALQFVYQGWGVPSKEDVAEVYQSDQLGLYGELYALFGFGSLPLFFAIGYLFKLAFVRMRGANPFTFAMKRVVVLFVFVDLLHSYGIDWVIQETIPLAAAIFIYGFFFPAKRRLTRQIPATAEALQHRVTGG
jgi:hypothetical protein